MMRPFAWFSALMLAVPAQAQVSQPLDSALLAGLKWRSIGPANMSGRVSDIEGLPSPSRTFYVATAAGGLWKTTNAGTTFDQVFGMNQPVISMGDLAIAPSDSNTLYLGTGEEDSRNSISPGAGMFKSTDGGTSFKRSPVPHGDNHDLWINPDHPEFMIQANDGGANVSIDGGRTWSTQANQPLGSLLGTPQSVVGGSPLGSFTHHFVAP